MMEKQRTEVGREINETGVNTIMQDRKQTRDKRIERGRKKRERKLRRENGKRELG